MYASDLAEVYELIYQGRGKAYELESQNLLELIRNRNPKARSLLDVACGTGKHLRCLGDSFEEMAGIDLSQDMLDIARTRIPDVPTWRADMRDFDLGRRFDIVTCLFSSVGYMDSPESLGRALRSMAGHLEPGGLLVVEPWYAPEEFIPGYISSSLVEDTGRVVSRISHSVARGRTVEMTVHYVYARADKGVQHFTDVHLMNLYTEREYRDAFALAGLSMERVPAIGSEQTGVGLLLATHS